MKKDIILIEDLEPEEGLWRFWRRLWGRPQRTFFSVIFYTRHGQDIFNHIVQNYADRMRTPPRGPYLHAFHTYMAISNQRFYFTNEDLVSLRLRFPDLHIDRFGQ